MSSHERLGLEPENAAVSITQRTCQALLVVGALLGCGLSGRADVILPQKVEGKIDWVYSYADGQRLARAGQKPMFVVFRCER